MSTPSPATAAQRTLWLLETLDPGRPTYHLAYQAPLPAGADEHTLAAAWQRVLAAEPALLAHFTDGPELLMTPGDPADAALHVERTASAEELAREPFDLTGGPLVRARLLRPEHGEPTLIVVAHHAVCDAHSLLAVLAALGVGPAAPAEPAGPATEGADEACAAFWRAELAGYEAVDVPGDLPRPAKLSPDGEVARWHDPALGGRLRAGARELGVPEEDVLLAALTLLLRRYTGAEDLVTGVAHRRAVGTAMGYHTTVLPVRVRVKDDEPAGDLATRVARGRAAAVRHGDGGLESVLRAVTPPHDPARTPLFGVVLAWDGPVAATAVSTGTTRFDLRLVAETEPGGDGLALRAEFRSTIFRAATVERLLGQLGRVLADLLDRPGTAAGDLDAIPAAERAALSAGLAYRPSPPGPSTVVDAVRATAAQRPDATAVEDGDTTLTYALLQAKADAIADWLLDAGAGPGVPVGLCLPRSPGLVTAVLGTLGAGAAVLPIDPTFPPERIRFMLADAATPLVLTTAELAGRIPPGPYRVQLLEDLPAPDGARTDRPRPAPDDLAYLLYTSGSTGRPKGVAMPHRALRCLIAARRDLPRVEPGPRRVLQFTTISFDVSFQEIFECWWYGDTLVLVDEDVRRDPAALLELLKTAAITSIYLPFVALEQLTRAAEMRPTELPALREVITAGEQLKVTPAVRDFFRHAPGAVLRNQYGPTETHIVTDHLLAGDPDGWPDLPPIGLPLNGSRAYVLDEHRRLLPPGAVGMLHFGGDCLARDYLNRPELTAERFTEIDAGAGPVRAYETGDLARIDADGNLAFLGRRDLQVKIRGYRVEIGEIEAVLGAHPAVAQAVVTAYRPDAGDLRLVGYWRPADGAETGDHDLRAYLGERLAPYMVPAHLMRVDVFPLTGSGKVHRSALPPPETAAPAGPAADSVRTPWEELVADVLRRRLGAGRVTRDDTFLGLGGHSLLALTVAADLRAATGVEVPVRLVLGNPTVRALAEHLQDGVLANVDPETLEAALAAVTE